MSICRCSLDVDVSDLRDRELERGGVGFGLAPIFTGGCDAKGEPETDLGECFENRVGEPDELMGRGEGERLKDAIY